jgi:hypothetical protein
MNFERGKDPKEAIGIGVASQIDLYIEVLIKNVGGSLWDRETLNQNSLEASKKFGLNIEIIMLNDRYSYDYHRIVVYCEKIGYRKVFAINVGLGFPTIQKVASRTIGIDLVPVKPIFSPESKKNVKSNK